METPGWLKGDILGETPDAEKRDELHPGANEPGRTNLAGEYRMETEHRDPNVGLSSTFPGARIPGEVWPYEREPVDIATDSQLLPDRNETHSHVKR
jgi:hypothetical protein